MKNYDEIDKALKAVCPVQGVSYVDRDDKSTWIIVYADDATDEQKQAAEDVLKTLELVEVEAAPDPLLQRIAALESKVLELDTSIGVLGK